MSDWRHGFLEDCSDAKPTVSEESARWRVANYGGFAFRSADMEQQLSEMAEIIWDKTDGSDEDGPDRAAQKLWDAGYRKQVGP